MTNQIEIQRIARLSDMNRQRLAQIEDQVVRLNNVKDEHAHVHTSLQNIQTTSQSSLVPLGAGIHLPIKFKDQQTTLIDIGSGILLEKTPQEAASILEIRINEIQLLIDSLTNEYQKTEAKIHELNDQLNKAVEEHNKDLSD
tara:strand:+ start:1268 stop:1693 length:426 start_codon:yes stop_codon:yes gene_type:complete